MFVFLSSFPRARNTDKFLYQLLPSWGLEPENNELILCQNSSRSVKDAAGVCAQPKLGLTWGNTVQQEPRKMSKATSTSTSQRMWWRRRKRTWTRSWARWEKHWQYPVQGDIPLFASSAPPPPPPESPPRLIINFVIIIAWLQFQFIWRCIIRNKLTA